MQCTVKHIFPSRGFLIHTASPSARSSANQKDRNCLNEPDQIFAFFLSDL